MLCAGSQVAAADKNDPRRSRRCSSRRSSQEALLTPKTEPTKSSGSLKRTLSYETAFRQGLRKQKSTKERMLRKILGARLSPLEPALLRGDFHDSFNRFKQDEFFDHVSPIVYSITGTPEECSDDELPGKCMVMAKDIMKKKKRYVDNKNSKRHNTNDAQPPRKRKDTKNKTNDVQPPRKRSRKKLILVHHDGSDVDSDVEKLFNTSYNCCNCDTSLELNECYPVKSRKTPDTTTNLLCLKCFNNTNAILDEVDLTNSKDKQDKLEQLPNKATKIKANKSGPKYKVHDYVLSQFPGFGDEWFHAEIYSKYRGKYHVYFLSDGSHLKNVEEDALREAGTETWTALKRSDFLNKPFEREGEEGKWHAVELGKSRRANKYGCKVVDKPSSEKLVWLDVCEVQQLIRKQSSS